MTVDKGKKKGKSCGMVGFVLSENYHFSIFIEKTYPQKSFFIFYGMEWALFL